MSTSETDEYKIAPCPCGAGSIVKSITTQDNPWSGADISHWIDCEKCSAEWSLGGYTKLTLTLRSSELPLKAARAAKDAAHFALYGYLRSLGVQHFAEHPFPTKVAEHAYLRERKAYSGDYRSYLKTRKKAAIHDAAYYDEAGEFVAMLVKKHDDGKFAGLLSAYKKARNGTVVAAKSIVTQAVN